MTGSQRDANAAPFVSLAPAASPTAVSPSPSTVATSAAATSTAAVSVSPAPGAGSSSNAVWLVPAVVAGLLVIVSVVWLSRRRRSAS